MFINRERIIGIIEYPIVRTYIEGEEYDEVVEKIYRLLPKKNCGKCGYNSCYECAIAIARGIAPPDACRVVGYKIESDIRQILMSGLK